MCSGHLVDHARGGHSAARTPCAVRSDVRRGTTYHHLGQPPLVSLIAWEDYRVKLQGGGNGITTENLTVHQSD